MANTTITALTNLASESIADEDVFVVDDITANETKKITFANLAAAIDTTQLANVLILQGNVVQLTANIDLVQDNVAALPDSAANDFVTYTRLNANIDVVQDNVAALPDSAANDFITYTRLNANINVVQDNVAALPDSAANDFITYTRLNANIDVVQDNVASITSRSDAFGSYANSTFTTNTHVDTKIAAIVDSAPDALNTLNELAAALGDDANFSTTILNSISSTETRINANLDIVQDNVSALPDSAANDFVTYTRLNANIDVVQDNVASITSRSDAFGTYANTNLDTKANVSATYFLALSNDFVTYTRLNANIDVVQDNVSALPDSAANDFVTYTRLNANIDVVQDNVAVIPSSFANAHYITTTTNSYNIGVTVASINEVDVYVGGVYQNKKEYILANSSHNVQFRDATFVAGEDIEIISRT